MNEFKITCAFENRHIILIHYILNVPSIYGEM